MNEEKIQSRLQKTTPDIPEDFNETSAGKSDRTGKMKSKLDKMISKIEKCREKAEYHRQKKQAQAEKEKEFEEKAAELERKYETEYNKRLEDLKNKERECIENRKIIERLKME